jgi:hypothetical protein
MSRALPHRVAYRGAYPAADNTVRTPYRGVPEATFDRVAHGQAALFIEWGRGTPLCPPTRVTGQIQSRYSGRGAVRGKTTQLTRRQVARRCRS